VTHQELIDALYDVAPRRGEDSEDGASRLRAWRMIERGFAEMRVRVAHLEKQRDDLQRCNNTYLDRIRTLESGGGHRGQGKTEKE